MTNTQKFQIAQAAAKQIVAGYRAEAPDRCDPQNVLRADVELINSAISNLGNSFAANRREGAEEDYRRQLLDRELARQKSAEQHYSAEQEHYKAMEDKSDQTLQHQQAQDAIKNMNGVYDKMLAQLQNGNIDEDQFNQQAKSVVDSVYDANHTILQNTPFSPWANDSSYRIKKGNLAMGLTPGKVGNRDVAIGPRGSVNFTDTFSPADKVELDDAGASLRQVQAALNKIEPDYEGNYSASQAAQIHRLSIQKAEHQARRQAVLQKYQPAPGASAPASTGGPAIQSGAPASSTTAALPDELNQAQDAIRRGAPADAVASRFTQRTGSPWPGAATVAKGKVLDADTARLYLQRSGGDKQKARQMATADGYDLSASADSERVPTVTDDPELNDARQAIQQGKDPEAVRARYRQRTGKDMPAKTITDKSGRQWLYFGSSADPTTDRNPGNWKAQ